MICPPCANAVDAEAVALRQDPGRVPTGHAPEVCHNHGKDIRACGCQHRAPSPGTRLWLIAEALTLAAPAAAGGDLPAHRTVHLEKS